MLPVLLVILRAIPLAGAGVSPAWAQPGPPASAAAIPVTPVAAAPLVVPRLTDRLRPAQLGLVINTADPYSVAVGAHYIARRGIPPRHVLRLELPLRESLTEGELDALRRAVDRHFGPEVQALALAWTQPWAVQCNSITAALTLGFDRGLCDQSCARSRPSPYFNAATARPFRDLGLRPSMLLAAPDLASGLALIDRGAAADGALVRRGAPPGRAVFVVTDDVARNVRARLYPAPGRLARATGAAQVDVGPVAMLADVSPVVLMQIGAKALPDLGSVRWVDGALADHLTSWGGMLTRPRGQATALDWIAAGATASHGAVSEPCNHLQKFPHPQVLWLNYLQGATAIEAYWKSVAWPQQSVFVGEPMAAPFARR